MQIGAMNHPGKPLHHEVAWMAELGLEFIDLTLEPPSVATWQVKPSEIRTMLRDNGMDVVGHTAYYLPIGSSFESLRRAAVDELKRAAEVFAEVGAKWMNVHPDAHAPFTDEPVIIQRNIAAVHEIVEFARPLGIGIMVENVPGRFNSVVQLAPILDAVPDAGLHLDIGHSNLAVVTNTAPDLIAHFGRRLAHVHLHDNRGGDADLHLALGMGDLDVVAHVQALRATGYNQTITLEVFSPDRHFLAYSRDRLRHLWEAQSQRGAASDPS